MSANIYEDPNLMTNVSYSRDVQKDGGEMVERVVAIYESADTFSDHENNLLTQSRGADGPKGPPGAQRNPFKAATVVLALLCVLMVAAIPVLFKFFQVSLMYQSRYEELQARYENLSNSLCLTPENSTVSWRRFQCSCYYKSAEMRNWTESRADCLRRGADLVIINSKEEQTFLGKLTDHEASWVGLQSVKAKGKYEWQCVDKSLPKYLAWQIGADTKPSQSSKVYVDKDGKLDQDSDGSRRWICEKQIK